MRIVARQLVVIGFAASAIFAVGNAPAAADLCAPRSVSVSDAGVLEGGPLSDGTLNFTVMTTGCSGGTVQYQTVAGGGGLPGAAAGVDFVVASGQLSWTAGDTAVQTISVSVLGDSAVEPDEGLTLNLYAPSGLMISDDSGLGTIVDDDLTIALSFADPSSRPLCAETCVSCWLTVVSNAPVPADVTVHFAARNGTAIGGADFATADRKVTIPAGAARAEFGISILDDLIVEEDEYFTVSISKTSAGRIGKGSLTITIVDDEGSRASGLSDGRLLQRH